jgi:hypothetical protein
LSGSTSTNVTSAGRGLAGLKEEIMTEPIITCPNCKTEIKLTESLAAPLIADSPAV